jgi:hypothetical protein
LQFLRRTKVEDGFVYQTSPSAYSLRCQWDSFKLCRGLLGCTCLRFQALVVRI